MSSQDVIADSAKPKSRLTASKLVRSAFSFDHTGSLKDRLLTALIVLAVAVFITGIALVVPHGGLIVVAWAGVVVLLSAFEAVRLFSRDEATLAYKPVWGALHLIILGLPGVVTTVVGVRHVVLGQIDWRLLFLGFVVSGQLLMLVHVLAGRARLEQGTRHGESFAPAFILLGICAPQLILISSLANGVHLIWWLAGVVALNDTGAYFAGKYLGKHKMAPALSPNKTVEGSVAGFVVGVGAGVIFGGLFLGPLLTTAQLIVLSLVVVLSAQAADLSKSYLKRLRGVKDTGSFFPGHGGVLDRFDGIIGGAPAVVVVLVFLGVL